MDKFTIWCTEEQTKLASELGAPIETEWHEETMYVAYDRLVIPTAEQMIGWLEENVNIIEICIKRISNWRFEIFIEPYIHKENSGYLTRKEATLAAIDEALEYLSNNKK